MTAYRVLVITNLWPSDSDPGYGSFVEGQMESLRPLGVDFDVLFIDGHRSRWNYARAVSEMWRRLKATRYDLIHAHFSLSGWVARCQWRVPVVVSFLGDDVLGRFKRNGRISLYGRFLASSSFVLSRLVAAVIVKSKPMRTKLGLSSAYTIPNGVNMDLFRPVDPAEARRALGLDPRQKFVLFPYDPAIENKRYDLVEAAVTRAHREIDELRILQASGVPQSRMPLYMSAADVLVLASHSEGSPNAIKEAMASNLPVITVDVGDGVDLIGSTGGCYVVRRDPDEIAAKIVAVCRRGTRTRGRESMTRLSLESVAKQLIEVYAAVLRG